MSVELPFLGPPREDQNTWLCGFMVLRGGSTHCDRPAEHHGLIFDDGLKLMATAYCCATHLSMMRLSTHLDHELGSACGLPDSRCEWDHGLSWCWLPGGVNVVSAGLEAMAQ
jgi:hypothetical protein